MGLYAVCAAKGAPGVTTTATALSLAWGAPAVLADLDPAGGDLAVRYRDAKGRPLQSERGLVSLAAAVRRGIDADSVSPHLQMAQGVLPVLAGVTRPEQVVGLGNSWGNVATALSGLPGTDVVADCGRLQPGSALMPVLHKAQSILFVVRPTVEELFHLRERLAGLAEQLGSRDAVTLPVTVAVVTDDRDRSALGQVQALLDRARLQVRVVGHLAHDGKAATRLRYDLLAPSRRSMLLRSASALAESMRSLAASRTRQYA